MARQQRGRVNIASGDDVVAVQAGSVGGGRVERDDVDRDSSARPGRSTNIRSGNARVGRQYDDVHGDLHISW